MDKLIHKLLAFLQSGVNRQVLPRPELPQCRRVQSLKNRFWFMSTFDLISNERENIPLVCDKWNTPGSTHCCPVCRTILFWGDWYFSFSSKGSQWEKRALPNNVTDEPQVAFHKRKPRTQPSLPSSRLLRQVQQSTMPTTLTSARRIAQPASPMDHKDENQGSDQRWIKAKEVVKPGRGLKI